METCELQQICNHPILTREEEISFGEKAVLGDEQAREALVQHNFRLVISIAKKFCTESQTLGDYVNVGTFGLMGAAKTYNPNKGVRFSTYATMCIRNAMFTLYKKQKKVDAFEVVSTDMAIGKKEELTLDDSSIHEEKLAKEEQLHASLDKLLPEDKFLLKARFGIAPNTRPILLREIAEVEGVTVERIRQKEVRALERFRAIHKGL